MCGNYIKQSLIQTLLSKTFCRVNSKSFAHSHVYPISSILCIVVCAYTLLKKSQQTPKWVTEKSNRKHFSYLCNHSKSQKLSCIIVAYVFHVYFCLILSLEKIKKFLSITRILAHILSFASPYIWWNVPISSCSNASCWFFSRH